jgi:hypothetical protein
MGTQLATPDQGLNQAVTPFRVWSMFRLAVEFTFLPDPVDIGFVGTGSAVEASSGASWHS